MLRSVEFKGKKMLDKGEKARKSKPGTFFDSVG